MSTSWIESHLWLIPFAPLAGAAVNGFLGKRIARSIGKHAVSVVACGSIFFSFLLSLWGVAHLGTFAPAARSITNEVYTWIQVGDLKASLAFLLDPLSSVMILVVSGIGFLIHVYSVGYMADDKGYARYFTYLNLFAFAMLMLVLGNNLLLMFVGWEGVGLCSYLLIGFWFEHRPNAVAGMKAFIVNRIGDFGFIVGIGILFWTLVKIGAPSVTFRELALANVGEKLASQHFWGVSVTTLVCLLLFLGATGKSAQIPLYVWLPDAMAGPTPVSALIHAATMVTAGVYMIGRLNFLFSYSPVALTVVACVGAATAIFSATIGFAQNDIKRVLAYSTVSQLGYMFLGMGVAAYTAGIFHLMTHAFFKACLFLGSGAVIHALAGEQDMRRMGGLKSHLPVVFWTFLAATVAISGIFPFAGFFSKDEILWKTFTAQKLLWPWLPKVLWAVAALAAGMTAFYMWRLMFMTFWGRLRWQPAAGGGHGGGQGDSGHGDDDEHGGGAGGHGHAHVHAPPATMWVVLVLLALGSVASGWVGWPHALGGSNRIEVWLEPVMAGETPPAGEESPGDGIDADGTEPRQEAVPRLPVVGVSVAHAAEGAADENEAGHPGRAEGSASEEGRLEVTMAAISILIALTGIFLAWIFYYLRPDLPAQVTARIRWFYELVRDKYRIDELYALLFLNPTLELSRACAWFDRTVIDGIVDGVARLTVLVSAADGWFDLKFVDGAVNLVADVTIGAGRRLRRIQTGVVQTYLVWMLLVLVFAGILWQAVVRAG